MNNQQPLGEQQSAPSSQPTEKELNPPEESLTHWYRIFGREQELALPSVEIEVYPELKLMNEPPVADLVLIRNKYPVWTEEQRSRLPDGIRDTDANRILIEFKYTESTNIWAVRQALSYDTTYMASKLRANPKFKGNPEAVLSTFLLSSKSPSNETLTHLGFYPAEKPGIYRCDDPIVGRVTILSLNDLAKEPHNALVKCFASKRPEKEWAFATLRDTGMMYISTELLLLLQGLEVTLVEKGKLHMTQIAPNEITAEYLMEVGKSIYEHYLPSLPIEAVIDYYPVERILSRLKPEERLMGLQPEDVLNNYRPEERLMGLRPEERLMGLQPEVIQQLANTQTLIQKLQQRLIRSLKRKFGDISNEVVDIIEQTNDDEQLDEWMDELVDANTLTEMTFFAAS
ncbi:MAG: hypothetical protein AAF639_15910 [Chloroflexota bacterium]